MYYFVNLDGDLRVVDMLDLNEKVGGGKVGFEW